MSLGDLPPRQKMINLMYLVLLCLLAMNVSKEILQSFLIINEGLERTTENFESKINTTYDKFARMNADDPVKVGEFYEHAQELKKNADDIVEYIDAVKVEIDKWLLKLPRQEIARKSIEERGAIIVTEDMDEAINLMNQIAPEHLEVATMSPFELLPFIKHAGAIFLGHNTPEAIGDYVAGPNHTLPTGGTAKFYSPLGVENFMKKSSIISFSKKAINEIGKQGGEIVDAIGEFTDMLGNFGVDIGEDRVGFY